MWDLHDADRAEGALGDRVTAREQVRVEDRRRAPRVPRVAASFCTAGMAVVLAVLVEEKTTVLPSVFH